MLLHAEHLGAGGKYRACKDHYPRFSNNCDFSKRCYRIHLDKLVAGLFLCAYVYFRYRQTDKEHDLLRREGGERKERRTTGDSAPDHTPRYF